MEVRQGRLPRTENLAGIWRRGGCNRDREWNHVGVEGNREGSHGGGENGKAGEKRQEEEVNEGGMRLVERAFGRFRRLRGGISTE